MCDYETLSDLLHMLIEFGEFDPAVPTLLQINAPTKVYKINYKQKTLKYVVNNLLFHLSTSDLK